jgi:hypothetical protein
MSYFVLVQLIASILLVERMYRHLPCLLSVQTIIFNIEEENHGTS